MNDKERDEIILKGEHFAFQYATELCKSYRDNNKKLKKVLIVSGIVNAVLLVAGIVGWCLYLG